MRASTHVRFALTALEWDGRFHLPIDVAVEQAGGAAACHPARARRFMGRPGPPCPRSAQGSRRGVAPPGLQLDRVSVRVRGLACDGNWRPKLVLLQAGHRTPRDAADQLSALCEGHTLLEGMRAAR